MTTTLPLRPRIGRDSPAPTRPALPPGERARGQLWSDIVFEALMALRNQLSSCNETIVSVAANSLLELERTRMRHGRCVAGSTNQSEAQAEFERECRVPHDDDSLFDDDDDEFDDEPAAVAASIAPRPAPPPPPKSVPDVGHLADHIEEVLAHFAETEGRTVEVPAVERYIYSYIDRWRVEARHIARRGFFAEMRRRGEGPETEDAPRSAHRDSPTCTRLGSE